MPETATAPTRPKATPFDLDPHAARAHAAVNLLAAYNPVAMWGIPIDEATKEAVTAAAKFLTREFSDAA